MDLSILRSAGQVAGIGGLTVAVFLLLAKQVLRAAPKPDKLTQQRYAAIINKILLYSFIIAIAGLLIYAFLEVLNQLKTAHAEYKSAVEKSAKLESDLALINQNYNQLQKDNQEIRIKIRNISESTLKEYAIGIEVLKQKSTFDITKWELISPQSIQKEKKYPVITSKDVELMRAFPECKELSSTFATSSPFEPIFNCNSHKLTTKLDEDAFPPGKQALHRWILIYDISGDPLFEPVTIQSSTTVWNSFANPDKEYAETFVPWPAHLASIAELFPESKKPKRDTVTCWYYPLGTGQSPRKVENAAWTFDDQTNKLEWQIPSPILGYHYRMEWNW